MLPYNLASSQPKPIKNNYWKNILFIRLPPTHSLHWSSRLTTNTYLHDTTPSKLHISPFITKFLTLSERPNVSNTSAEMVIQLTPNSCLSHMFFREMYYSGQQSSPHPQTEAMPFTPSSLLPHYHTLNYLKKMGRVLHIHTGETKYMCTWNFFPTT